MPEIEKDPSSGALIFNLTPEEKFIRDLVKRVDILEKEILDLKRILKEGGK